MCFIAMPAAILVALLLLLGPAAAEDLGSGSGSDLADLVLQADNQCTGDTCLAESLHMLQRRAQRSGTSSAGANFAATSGTVLGRYRLIDRLGVDAKHAVDLLEWPTGLEGLESKFGDGNLLGRGGQGEVWSAKDLVTGEPVAVKLFLDRTVKPPGFLMWDSANESQKEGLQAAIKECDVMQFLEKQKAADPVGSSHVLRCIDNNIIPKDNPPLPSHIVLELGGDDLTKWIQVRNTSRGDPEEARRLVAEIAMALRFLQAVDPPLIHHDLKPQNVMLMKRGGGLTTKIFDFGCATNGTEEGRHGKSMFTLAYADPEVTNGHCKDPKDPGVSFKLPLWSFDVFSLGMIYWQLLCPRMSPSNGEVMAMMRFLCFPPPIGLGPFPPGVVEEVLGAVDRSGAPMCPPVPEGEMRLIQSMVGPSVERPSPSDVLEFPLLAKYAV